MYKIITQFQQIIEFAKKFSAANNTNGFVPAYADYKTEKKPACKGFIDYEEENAIRADRLIEFQSMTCLGVRLGNDYIVFDLDGSEAVALFKTLEKTLGVLPETFHNGSLPGDREAFWFRIPHRWQGKFSYINLNPDNSKDAHKLEVRSGKCHQVACGEHPTQKAYKQLSKTIIVAELPEAWCMHVAGKMAQAEIESGVIPVTSNENGNGKKQYDNEGKLSQAVKMLDFLLAVNHPLASDFTYDNRFRIGCALNSIDDSDVGLETWFDWVCKAADCEYKSIEDLKPHWVSIKQDKNRGVTFGTIIAAFNTAYTASKKDPELSGIADQYRALYSHTTTAKQPIVEFFESTYYYIENDQSFSLPNALLQYSTDNRIRLSELEGYWETWFQTKSINKVAQMAALSKELEKFSADVTKIYDVLPGGKEVKQTLTENNFDLLIGLFIWIAAMSSTVPKKRQYQFSKSPTASGIFISIIAESGKGKSPFIEVFTDPLVQLDDINRDIDIANQEEFKKVEWIYKDTPRKERCNLKIDKKFGGDYDLQAEKKEDEEIFTDKPKINSEFLESVETIIEDENVPVVEHNGEIVYKPEPAKDLRHYIYSDGTPEAFRDLNANQQDHMILWVLDEMGRIDNTMQSYNGGNSLGNDGMLIGIMNGDRIKTKLVNRNVYGRWGASLITGVQDQTLEKMSMLNDSTGKTGRFIFLDGSNIDIDHVYVGDSTQTFCHDRLLELYGKMDKLPIGISKPGREVFYAWKDWDRQCRDLADIPGVNFGYRFWLRKIGKNILKIAGILQDWIYCDMEVGTYDPFVITDEVVLTALKLGDYLVEYHRRLFKCTIGVGAEIFADDIDPELLEHQAYIMRYLAKRGKPATLNDIYRNRHFQTKKMNSVAVRTVLESMTDRVKFEPSKGYSLV